MIELMPEPVNLVLIIPICLAIIFFVLFIYQLFTNIRLRKHPDHVLDQAQNKSYQLLSQAIKKAESIIAIAELQGIKITSQSKLSTQSAQDKYSQALEELSKQSSDGIVSTTGKVQQMINKLEQDFKTYLDTLTKQADTSTKDNEELIRQKINSLFESFEVGISNFLTETQQQSIKAVELEMQAARQLIQTYKQQQFNLIDENIVAMMEQTLSMVLAKKLSLKDQVDLVYESLEKAKAEKFII